MQEKPERKDMEDRGQRSTGYTPVTLMPLTRTWRKSGSASHLGNLLRRVCTEVSRRKLEIHIKSRTRNSY